MCVLLLTNHVRMRLVLYSIAHAQCLVFAHAQYKTAGERVTEHGIVHAHLPGLQGPRRAGSLHFRAGGSRVRGQEDLSDRMA